MWCYTLLPQIWNMSLTASVVILAVLLAWLLLRRAPKVFSYVLWAVVLFRLLCPVSLPSGLSLLTLVGAPVSEENIIEYIPPDIAHIKDPAVQLPMPGVSGAINEALPHGEEQLAADPLEAPLALATLLWLLGIAGLLTYSGATLLRLRRKLVGAVRLRDNIWMADGIATPFVLGLFRPKIYLPSSLPEGERDYVILHEQHHIRRGDPAAKLLLFAALCVHWFNPLVWLAFVLAGRDMEMSCDEAVLRKLGEGARGAYSQTLLDLAAGRHAAVSAPLAFGEGDPRRRIQNILNWKKSPVWIAAAAVLVCAAVILVCALNPKQEMPAAEGASLPIAESRVRAQEILSDGMLESLEPVETGNGKLLICTQPADRYGASSHQTWLIWEDPGGDRLLLQDGGLSTVIGTLAVGDDTLYVIGRYYGFATLSGLNVVRYTVTEDQVLAVSALDERSLDSRFTVISDESNPVLRSVVPNTEDGMGRLFLAEVDAAGRSFTAWVPDDPDRPDPLSFYFDEAGLFALE